MERAEGLDIITKNADETKAGKTNGYLLEGMACLSGCIGGAGTRVPLNVAERCCSKGNKGIKGCPFDCQ